MHNTTILIPAKIVSVKYVNYLQEAIKSAIGQGEIFVLFNNCSEDISEIENRFKKDVTFFEDNKIKNLSGARNYLASRVSTRYFFFLDADDILPEGCIEQAETWHPGKGYLYGDTELFTDTSIINVEAKPFNCADLTRGVYFPNGVLQLAKNFRTVGEWDTDLDVLEDKEWWIRAVKRGVCGTPKPGLLLYRYRQHEEGLVGLQVRNKALWDFSEGYIQEKHRDYYEGSYRTMPCCGQRNPDPPVEAQQIEGTRVYNTVDSPNFVNAQYLMGTGRTTFYGPVSGQPYVFEGEGDVQPVQLKDAYTGSLSRPGLLEILQNGNPIFREFITGK